jgi:formate hydrogenlyase subunit 6/NADH:ubiquinone oxidoreductase subunit I
VILDKVLYLPKSYLGGAVDLLHQLGRLLVRGDRVESAPLPDSPGIELLLPSLRYDSDGKPLCDGCLLCQHYCPTECITIDLPELPPSSDKQIAPTAFHLDPYRCISCKLCIEVCPIDALNLKAHGLGGEGGS